MMIGSREQSRLSYLVFGSHLSAILKIILFLRIQASRELLLELASLMGQ
jgi:hypothetical protein